MKGRTIAWLGAVCALAAAAVAMAQPGPGSRRAILYEYPNFQGRSYTVYGGNDALALTGFEDRAMSARFEGDWTICEHDFYQGHCETVSGPIRNLDRWGLGHSISSLRAVRGWGAGPGGPGGPGGGRGRTATLFEFPNFQGRSYTVFGGNNGLGPTGFEDRAMSGYFDGQWVICEHDDMQGHCETVTGNIPDLNRYGLSRSVSSLQAIGARRR